MEKKYIKPEIEVMETELEQLMAVSDGNISMDEIGSNGENAISREMMFDFIDEYSQLGYSKQEGDAPQRGASPF